jgi:hypothetical protein
MRRKGRSRKGWHNFFKLSRTHLHLHLNPWAFISASVSLFVVCLKKLYHLDRCNNCYLLTTSLRLKKFTLRFRYHFCNKHAYLESLIKTSKQKGVTPSSPPQLERTKPVTHVRTWDKKIIFLYNFSSLNVDKIAHTQTISTKKAGYRDHKEPISTTDLLSLTTNHKNG